MALATVYKQFLATPDPTQLAAEAALHYITTTTSYRGSADVLKHLNTTAKQLNKKKQELISVIEGQNAIAAEVDTVLEFITSGGPYLPALDDNFLADRTVYLPMIHIVTFDNDHKILQIRQTWDQGSLLKQLDVIGRTGRNWPIRDSKEQIRLIETCIKSSSNGIAGQEPNEFAVRSRGNSNNVLRDPHASLALFAPRDDSDQTIASVISPRGGARPRQRDFVEILGDEPVEGPNRDRSESPSKAVAPKAGGDKKFHPSRLFEDKEYVEENDESETGATSNRISYRPHPKKYNHFDFSDGTGEPQDVPQPNQTTPKKTKHTSQWCFDDFVTPQRPHPSKTLRNQEVRHWGTENDENQESPERKAVPVKARRDAETHFEFKDDGTPNVETRFVRPRGTTHNDGLGLYENNLYSEDGNGNANEDGADSAGDPHALSAITNLKDRGRDFEAHWEMKDNSPVQKPQPKPTVSEDRKKVVKMMESNWTNYNSSPLQKENNPVEVPSHSGAHGDRGIHIGGDGMGGGRGSNRDWLFGDEDNSQAVKPANRRKPATATSGGFNWDF